MFLLINNAVTVADVTPTAIFVDRGQAMRALYEYEQVSVFKPILLYEYVLTDGIGKYPLCFYRVKRNWKSIVEGIEKVAVNQTEFKKQHPFIFDKLESIFEPSTEIPRAV